MFHTFERELIADQRHADLLRAAIRRQRLVEATAPLRATGLRAALTGRLRRATAVRPVAAVRA